MKLLDFKSIKAYHEMSWDQISALKSLKRNWFPGELYWRQSKKCSGFTVSDKPDCEWRVSEMTLLSYTPVECIGEKRKYKFCERLVVYARLDIHSEMIEVSMLQFMTTIFTCIILGTGSILFANDTNNIVIRPITKMVSIIKTLADDPLKKPEPPIIDDNETDAKKVPKTEMKTVELQKTIFRIGNLL